MGLVKLHHLLLKLMSLIRSKAELPQVASVSAVFLWVVISKLPLNNVGSE